MRLATRSQSLELDRTAQAEYGLTSDVLMGRAVSAAERVIRQGAAAQIHSHTRLRAGSGAVAATVIVAGPGNNGEDGRRLANRLGVRAVSCSEFLSTFSLMTREQAPALIVDAVFGTGGNRAPRGEFLRAIQLINLFRARYGTKVLALDSPSGLDLDCGLALAAASDSIIMADWTVSFGCAKPGFFLNMGPGATGALSVDSIGLPSELIQRVCQSHWLFSKRGFREGCRRRLPPREPRSNKTHFGHTAIIGGSDGMEGAAVLAARAAFRVGCGYVTWVSDHQSDRNLASIPHVMHADLRDVDSIRKATVLAIGPGLSERDAKRVRPLLLAGLDRIVVLDAGALSYLQCIDLLPRLPGRRLPDHWIVTPHTGEAKRLLSGYSPNEFSPDSSGGRFDDDRVAAAQRLRSEIGGTVLLKGFHSVVAVGSNRTAIVNSGGPALAKAGTGDVLTGMIAGFAAQLRAPQLAALLGCYLHGAIADSWTASRLAVESLEATDLIEMIPDVFSRLRLDESPS